MIVKDVSQLALEGKFIALFAYAVADFPCVHVVFIYACPYRYGLGGIVMETVELSLCLAIRSWVDVIQHCLVERNEETEA